MSMIGRRSKKIFFSNGRSLGLAANLAASPTKLIFPSIVAGTISLFHSTDALPVQDDGFCVDDGLDDESN